MKIELRAALCAVLLLCGCGKDDATDIQAKPALTVTVTAARRVDWPVTISATGNIQAWQKASIGTEIGGVRIAELRVDIGDTVKKGDVLARLASDTLEASLAQQDASVARARVTVAQAEADNKRARTLAGTGAISEQELAQYETTEKSAQADLALALAQQKAQRLNLGYAGIIAPDDGVIASRSAALGDVVQAGTELFTLIRQNRLEWVAQVADSEIGQLALDQKAIIDAPQGNAVEGTIRLVSPTIDPANRNGLAFVTFVNDGRLRDGMFVRGRFLIGSRPASVVPEESVVVQNGYSYVFTVTGDMTQRVRVQTGRRQDNEVEITEGLKGQESIVVTGAGFLNGGEKIQVVDSGPNAKAAPKAMPQ